MTTHVYGSRWMRGGDSCQSDAEHDLRDEVEDLRRALMEAMAQAHAGCRDIPFGGWRKHSRTMNECEECIRIRGIAEGGGT